MLTQSALSNFSEILQLTQVTTNLTPHVFETCGVFQLFWNFILFVYLATRFHITEKFLINSLSPVCFHLEEFLEKNCNASMQVCLIYWINGKCLYTSWAIQLHSNRFVTFYFLQFQAWNYRTRKNWVKGTTQGTRYIYISCLLSRRVFYRDTQQSAGTQQENVTNHHAHFK